METSTNVKMTDPTDTEKILEDDWHSSSHHLSA
jgi:hypothetical protein